MTRTALLVACLLLAGAANTQSTAAPNDPVVEAQASASASAQAATADERLAPEQQAKDEMADRHCLRHTGSRLVDQNRKDRQCANAPGRAYTREDLDRTGAVDLADALRRLDPAIR